MPDYAARTQDGHVSYQGTSYALAQVGSNANASTAAASIPVGQHKAAANDFRIYRAYLSFDTSAIPAGSIVESAVLTYYVVNDLSLDSEFDINIYYGVQPTFGGTLAYTDWGSGTIGPTLLRNTSGITLNTLYTVTLPTASINAGGITEYELRSSREGTAPTGQEYAYIGSADNATYKPYLTVTHSLPSGEDSMDQDGACVVLIYV
jgi:hypothetical protein